MTNTTALNQLDQYLSACRNSYARCIDVIEHDYEIDGIDATLRFHHLKFDGNGRPMVDTLVEVLYEHIIDYCLSTKQRQEPLTAKDATRLTKKARELFRHLEDSEKNPDESGEAGELLLYFLIEAVLGAPQIVAKMELKTNPKDEVKGSDGIHMKWNFDLGMVDLFFGEAKLYKDVNTAMKRALDSIDSFQDNTLKHELKMVTNHFKYSNPKIQETVENLFRSGSLSSDVRVNHACLIGYECDRLKTSGKNISIKDLIDDFRQAYLLESRELSEKIQKKLDNFNKKHLVMEIFFIPFPTVQEFRSAFNRAIS